MSAPQSELEVPHIVLVTDKPTRPHELTDILRLRCPVDTLPVATSSAVDTATALCAVVDVELETGGEEFKRVRERVLGKTLPLIFVMDGKAEPRSLARSLAVAKSLGATNYFTRPFEASEVLRILRSTYGSECELKASSRTAAAEAGVAAAQRALSSILEVGRTKRRFTLEEVTTQEHLILDALRISGIKAWLETVRRHHSATYRHSLLVTGLAVAFAQSLGMRPSDQRRLARAGLLHDIGKAFTPLGILDKPGKLTSTEMDEIRRHPVLGYEHLLQQGGFPEEILDCVRHHHEFLDGSGYPDGLGATQIGDLVRVVTIADVFSALIEERAYRSAMQPRPAFQIMQQMSGKLDTDLLRAFRPIALDADGCRAYLSHRLGG